MPFALLCKESGALCPPFQDISGVHKGPGKSGVGAAGGDLFLLHDVFLEGVPNSPAKS